jgi:AraC family transcriptional regulator
MNQWLPGSGKEMADSVGLLERYGKDFDPQTGRGDVEIWIPIKD